MAKKKDETPTEAPAEETPAEPEPTLEEQLAQVVKDQEKSQAEYRDS